MNEQSIPYSSKIKFSDFVFKHPFNRKLLKLAIVLIILQFATFKYFYPFPNFIHDDSAIYLETAYKNYDINSYMVGYSRFLRFISVFTTSDLVFVASQYLIIQIAALFLLFSIFFYYKLSSFTRIILFLFLIVNPLSLYLANMVSSDGYFLGLSLLWFSLLIQILNNVNALVLTIHIIVLFLAFTVRYNALIYPAISLIAIYLSKLPIKGKFFHVVVCFIVCGLFVTYTTVKYKRLTGYWQYAPFSGWQLANNGMYAYRFVESSKKMKAPSTLKGLDSIVRLYFDSTKNASKHPKEFLMASTFYMWDRSLPLYYYRNQIFRNDTLSTDFRKWAMMGPLYKKYGLFLITTYPKYYIKYFIWPNAKKYFAPPLEYLEEYNAGRTDAVTYTNEWFGYSKVRSRLKDSKTVVLTYYPILSGIMNILFLFSLIIYMILYRYSYVKNFHQTLILAFSFWLVNAGFSIFSTSAALRFLSFPIILMSLFTFIFIDYIYRLVVNLESQEAQLLKSELISKAI